VGRESGLPRARDEGRAAVPGVRFYRPVPLDDRFQDIKVADDADLREASGWLELN